MSRKRKIDIEDGPPEEYEHPPMKAYDVGVRAEMLEMNILGSEGYETYIKPNDMTIYVRPKWKETKNCLPESGDWMLVSDGKYITLGCYDICDWVGTDPHITVTHWMPLPELPEVS